MNVRAINVRGVYVPSSLAGCCVFVGLLSASLAGLDGLQGLLKGCEWSSQLQGEVKVLAKAVHIASHDLEQNLAAQEPRNCT